MIHPTAIIDQGAVIGDGTSVWQWVHVCENAQVGANCVLSQGVYIGPGVVIGDGTRIQNHVSVYAGVTLEPDVFIGPSVVFTNISIPRAFIKRHESFEKTLVRKGASIGANATIVCGVEVGRYAMVGAGAVVTKDVPSHTVTVGVPARPIGWVCSCGLRLDKRLACKCGRQFHYSNDGLCEI